MIKKLSLGGLRVLNTRPEDQGQALNQAIQNAGGHAISCPTIAIIPIPATNWLPLLPPLLTIQYAIFTSVNAVSCFFDGLESHAILTANELQQRPKFSREEYIHWPKQIKIIAIGKTTAETLESRNITVHFVPKKSDSEHLLALPALKHIEKHKLLLIKGEGGRGLIPETLTARGANLTIINVYRRTIPELNHNELARLWQNDAIDIIVFTSQESMQNLFVLLGAEAKSWLQQKTCLVISPRLAAAASLMGIKNCIICQPDNLIDILHQYQGRLAHEKKIRDPNTSGG